MKCPDCGNDELQEHHRFCSNCGCKLSALQSAKETRSQTTNSSQGTQSVEDSDAAGVQTNEKGEKFEDVQSDDIPPSERKKCFERPGGVETDAVHPTEGEKVIEKSEEADDDTVYSRENSTDEEKSRRATHPNAETKRTEKPTTNDVARTSIEKKDEKKLKDTEYDAAHLSKEKQDEEKPKDTENDAADTSMVKQDEEKPKGTVDDAADTSMVKQDEEKPKGTENDAAHLNKEKQDEEKAKGTENDAADTSMVKQDEEKPKGTENDAAHPNKEKQDEEKAKGTENDAAHTNKKKQDEEKAKGTENDAAHTNKKKQDEEKPKGTENDAAHTNKKKQDEEKAKATENDAAHTNKKKQDEEKAKGTENDAARTNKEKQDEKKLKSTENDTAHSNREKQDKENPKGTENDATDTSMVKQDEEKPKGAKNDGKKDVEKKQGAKNDATHSTEGKKDCKNSDSARNVESMTVIFHALLTPTFNINFQQGDKVVLRGGSPFSWHHPGQQVQMRPVREFLDGNYLLQGEAKLTLKQASGIVAYKYVVIPNQGRTVKDKPAKVLWECLIDYGPFVNGKHVNRCLRIPETSIKSDGTWHQYDDAIFSQPGFWDSIRSIFPHWRNDPAEGRRLAMKAMLPEWEGITLKQGGMNAHDALSEINSVVYCVSKAEIENGGLCYLRSTHGFDFMEVLCGYLFPQLNRNIQILQVQSDDKESQAKRLITSMIIASTAVRHQTTFLGDDQLKKLLECLLLDGTECEALFRHFPKKQHLSMLADYLFKLCMYVIEYRRDIFHWLFAMPLLHFLSNSVQPFSSETLTLEPSSVKDTSWWGTQGLDPEFQSVRQQAAFSSNSSPVHLLHQLSPMFEVDPLFTRTFLLTLPISDIAKVLERKQFPLHEVCWTLVRVVEERPDHTYVLPEEQWDSLGQCLQEMNDSFAGVDSMEHSNSQYEAMTSLANAALHLLRYLLTVDGVVRKRFQVVSGIFKLLDQSLLIAKSSLSPEEAASEVTACNEIFQVALQSLQDSLEKLFRWSLLLASGNWRNDELQAWSHLLSVKLEDMDLQQFWECGIKESLKSRIHKVDHKDSIELFCTLDLSAYHQDIGECFESAAFEAIDHLLKVGIAEEPMASLSSRLELPSFTHRQASGVGRLFSLFLKSSWPEGEDGKEISQNKMLQHILSWKPMAQFFNYFGSGSQLKKMLSHDGLEILVSATSLVTHVGLCLKNGEIQVNTLRIVQKSRDRFLELYSLISKEEGVTRKINEDQGSQQEVGSMEIFLDMRIEELKSFENEREAVSTFIEMCSVMKTDVDFQGIKEKLEKDLASCQMHDICHKRGTSENPIVKFFDLSTKNKIMMRLLHLIHPSRLFHAMWQQCIPRAIEFCKDDPGSNGTLTVDKVHELLWTHAYQRWRGMWERIIGGEISLREVDERFDKFRSDPKTLEIEVRVVVACFSDEEDIVTSVRQRVTQIKHYHKLKECKGAATAILEFQKAMKLEGDFDLLLDFCSQLNDEFLRRPLGAIGDEVFKIGENLERLPHQMIECLRTVIKCKDYIFWLRKEVKGREEVKTLVDLAMMSAGESDIETDRVSCLHTTALGFAPFIFDLDKSADLSQLIHVCERVWEEIKGNTLLPEQLRDISRHLEWLEGVKDAHAMSSLKLAQAINERGVYSVGKLDNVLSTQQYDKKSIDSVISLLLLPSNSNGEAKEFSLEKLKELQSKLALISGKRSHGQDDVEKFGQLLQGVIQLGQAYVNLCEIGDVSHLDWTQEYKCKSFMGKKVIDDIESKRTEFERRFSACKEHINSLRMKHHELNYFTIKQLLFLRKELAGLKHSATINSLHLQVYALLEKVLPGLHRSSLQTALLGAGIFPQHLHDDTYSDDTASRNESELMPSCIQEREDQRAGDQQLVEKYELLLNSVEKLNYPEPDRLAVAALVENSDSSDVDLVLWCVQNNTNSDLIDEHYDKALDDPRFRGIVDQDAESDLESSRSSQDSDDIHESLTEGSGEGILDSSTEDITRDEKKEGTYLSLDEIGVFLSYLANNGERAVRRKFPSFLKRGTPNLLLARKAVLGLYMDEKAQSLLNSDEILICSSDTTSEEVELLWRRALSDKGDNLYCLVNGDLLDYDVSQKVVDCLHTLMQDYGSNEHLALVVLCSSENEERAHIVTSLEQYKVKGGMPRYPRPDELRRFLDKQFKAPHPRPGLYCEQHVIWSAAADVGRAKNLNAHVVTSNHSGVGKSLVVQRLAEQVSNLQNNRLIADTMKSEDEEPPPLCVTIPFHDKRARVADVVGYFLPHALHSDIPLSRIFHIDRSATVTPELEILLFNLLILGEITDDCGRVWRRNPYDLYILEITDPLPKEQEKETRMYKFHELLPSIRCFLPMEILRLLQRKSAAQRNNSPLFDEEELQSEAVQRACQYLQLYNSDPRLIQHFDFDAQQKSYASPEECLETLIRNCGVVNPSWSELRYFVSFLNNQLRDCEGSVFCKTSLVDDTLEGFRSFVVAFMIIMSKDFSTRSLKENVSSKELAGADEERDIAPFQLRRRWEGSSHPYIFFNRPNNDTMSFLGFRVDEEGNLLDPRTEEIIQERLMTKHLRTGLHVQRVDFNTDFESYSKPQKIQLLCSVMGMGFGFDPDESYELTGDNVKKILAIHMRFRCNIPVVIMGETGCGKTRLIRYLCRLQTEGLELKNMLLMKIHGGTTYKDIERNVLHAEMMALKNEQINRNVDTVLFFDEANTSEALGMIKEIMVDRRCNGRPLSDRLKFIVACNPYRRHTDEMIQKLESAGLGYHVRADETEERLGRIPLRHLVYRVHALPESMRSLVWDFGQLNPTVEELYTRQIVRRYVQGGRLPGDDRLVIAIAAVLAASQEFMRRKKDECSFVSLRDVKRAMEVMVWFYENFDNFSPLIQGEDGDGGDDDDDGKDDNNGVESREEFKEERPSYSQEPPIIEKELFSREDEPLAIQKESPFSTDWRPVSLIEERHPPKKERVFFEDAEFSSKERPAVRRERLVFKEGRPTLTKTQSPLKEEHPTIKEERSAFQNVPSALKEERSILKEKGTIIRKPRSRRIRGRSTIKEEPTTLEKEGPTLFESLLPRQFPLAGREEPIPPKEPDLPLPEEIAFQNVPSALKEERSILKEKGTIIRKPRSRRVRGRSTIKEEPTTLEKEGPTPFESLLLRRFPLAGREEPIPPKEPDLPLPEEIVDAPQSQENLSDNIDQITWSLILALGVCYQARLTDRDEYRETVAKSFQGPCRLPGGAERIEKEISRCQEAFMAQLELGPNIARNAALTENVFMMVVCIELRIPLFVVGKPGSSKSLAKTVVADNMQGENSKSELFKKFKQIQLVSYQCSPQSTPEGILATFKQCSELQQSKKSDRFASVVVLDEIGLAEDSPKMPLKTLHPLLEDGNQDEEDIIQTEERFTPVAFIGLSNWALDPAKMNRGIMLCRNEPDGDELEATARGICGGGEDIMTLIEPLISPIVRGYTVLYNEQKSLKKLKDGKKDEFFGLRDFYSLLKMIVHIAREEKRRPNREELEHVIKRNFSGLLEDDFDPIRIIMGHVMPEYYEEEEEERRGLDSVDLIRASLDRKSTMGEGRYLLIMTENFATLPRVKQILLEKDSEEPYVIFGSGFPKDQLFTQVCRNINRVKICMETGRTVILLNLENLYESLYDALNQYYVTFGGENYVDLGLGNHRVKCRVHKNFRLIVIADKDVVYNKFPIPLINRLEKHFLVMSSGLTYAQEQVSRELNAWVEDFAHIFQPAHETKKRTFEKADAFIGYHQDSVPAVVLQVCAELHDDGSVLSDEDRESWKENVLKHCQERLLQCATPDSVTRLRSSRLSSQASSLWTTYFREQEHSSLANFLDKVLSDVKSCATSNTKIALRVQISTHSRLLSDRDIHDIAEVVGLPQSCVKCVSLQQFQTEQQFCNCIGRDFWARLGGGESLLIVQCDSADKNLDLVACSRHLLIEECREMENELDPDSTGHSHILMIVQLSRVKGGCSDFVGMQSEDWLSVHIDELCPPTEEVPAIEALVGRSVSGIFESALQKTEHNLSVSQILSSCVQEAASRIEDDETTLERATKRIELLLKLLTLEKETGKGRFELVLAQRLHQLLKEKDQRTLNQGNDWLQTEALSRTVNETGTFKKALWRRFQSVVAPILAEVIAYLDRDGNLELAASRDTWVFNLWLNIFGDSSLSELSFESFMSQEGDISVVRNKVPVPKSGYGLHAFQSKFPFSWLVKERIDELYREARSIAANSHENVTECLRTLLNSSRVNSIVSEAITEGGENTVAACYLHDFTHMVYKPRSEGEVEVVQRAITAAAREIHHSAQSLGENFVMDLPLVHVAHSRIQRRLNCLSLLLQTTSDIAQDLLNTFSRDENEMTIDAIALQMCLERMEPTEEDIKDMSRRQAWCDLVLSVKIPVEEMMSKSSTGDEARIGEKSESIITQCRCMWQRLSAVRMFIEHVYPYQDELYPQDLQNTLTLWKALGDRTDFSKTDSLISVERFLVRCSEDSIPRSKADEPEDHEKFLQRCNSFFMEIVSVFCFGEDVRELDPDVFEMLMRFVTGSQSTCETKEFSPFPEFGMDSSPVVRSFLLQQLINSNDKRAKKHLARYLYGVQGLSSEVPHILNVCLLAVQCMENSWISSLSKNANLDLAVNIGVINKLCQDALKILNKDFTSFDELQVDSLEAVAKTRYLLGVTAEYLYMSCVSDDEQWSMPGTRNSLNLLFANVRALCTKGHSRSPALYLLKQLVKRYGGHSIATISQNEEHSWIVPAEFQRREDDGMTLDRFLVYGVLYREVRDSLARAILSGNTDELIASLEALSEFPGHTKDIVILLALYREVAVPQGMWSRNQHDKNALIIDVILKRFLSTSARNLAKDLLKNSQGQGFPFLPFQDTGSVIDYALPEILFHVTAVLQCINFDGILEPLRAIILAPNSMLDSFLPTMPEDSFGETVSAMSESGNWYECPAGHRYFVGDCGKPDQTRDCPWCESGVAIGGTDHHLVQNNKLASRHDRSNTGHILGAPQRVIAERDLSPANVSLLRVILHSAMLAGAYQQPEVVSQLMHPEVPAGDICRFIWEHLVNDVRNVSTSLERSEDEVLLLIHLVLSEIMNRSTMRELDYNGKWSTKAGRKEWENEFVNVFARPICTNLEERLQNFYGLSVNDRRLGNDPLMREIYEVDTPPPTRRAADIHPGHAAFWKHRTRVTVEYVIRQFQDVKSNMATCNVLGKFLAEEHNLRAVRYLPDILALLKILTDRFHRRIDREKANQLKIRELLQEFSKKGQKENVTKLFRSFSAAWDQVRHHLSSQGRFAPTKEQCSQSIEMTSTASVLLPATAGAGVCCKGLLFFLVNVHNELVQTYCNAVNPNGSARTAEKIPLSEVSMSQLIAYDSEKDLMPVMLATCSYTLEVGKETQLQYNWETLEKRIIDRFIRGRLPVRFELDDFMFREDARDDFSFDQLRIKIPQEPIQGHIRTQILSELKDLRDVSDLRSMLEMAIGFLSRVGGNPEMKISDYLKTVLLVSEGKSSPKIKKVQQSCSLSNILDLWSTLAIVRAEMLLKNEQDPFEEVPHIFKTEMPRKVTTRFSAALKKINMELFLKKVVEVISLWLPQEDEQTGDMGLGEYLDGKLQHEETYEERYEERIPEEVCVKHVIYAWQLALEARERDQGRRRSMMS